MTEQVVWAPQPGPQMWLLQCPIFDVFFGGARGGGKTDALLGDFLQHAITYGPIRGIMFRRSMPELEESIQRAREIYEPLGWGWREKKGLLTRDDGAELRFRFIESSDDAAKYQGRNLQWVGLDEVTNWPDPAPLDKLYATLRSASGVPCKFRCSGNPGGPGHGWVKRRYVDPSEPMQPFEAELAPGISIQRCYIPSRVQDNRVLMENDPGYIARLHMVGDEMLVKAWLDGDWDVTLGQFFTEFDPGVHVIPEQEVPQHWTKFRAMDWGSKTPFSVGWYAVADGEHELAGCKPPAGALVKYREWYGANPRGHNRGLVLSATEVARGVLMREREHVDFGVADYQIFRHDNGPTIAEDMARCGVFWRGADKDRVQGWNQIRTRLKGLRYGHPDWRPMLYVMANCPATIAQIQAVQYDEKNMEDILKGGEDHAVDETRYACMARPWMKTVRHKSKRAKGITLNQLVQAQSDKRRIGGY